MLPTGADLERQERIDQILILLPFLGAVCYQI